MEINEYIKLKSMGNKSIKIVMCGCCDVGIDMVDGLAENGIQISHFVSLTPEMAEREKVSGYCSFESIAEKYRVPIYYAQKYNLKSEVDLNFFKTKNFDILLVFF